MVIYREMHDRALACADMALERERAGDHLEAILMYREASELEYAAYNASALGDTREFFLERAYDYSKTAIQIACDLLSRESTTGGK